MSTPKRQVRIQSLGLAATGTPKPTLYNIINRRRLAISKCLAATSAHLGRLCLIRLFVSDGSLSL